MILTLAIKERGGSVCWAQDSLYWPQAHGREEFWELAPLLNSNTG